MLPPKTSSQLDKFKEAARQLETDDDPERFKERMAALVKHKPVEPSEPIVGSSGGHGK